MSESDFSEDQVPKNYISSERLKAFTDGVVAIALTLLILPLLETVPEAVKSNMTAQGWYVENKEALFLFVLSFLLVGLIWNSHARVFMGVRYLNQRLSLLNSVWLLAIVFLPVATALMGLQRADAMQFVLYIGSLFVGQLAMVGMAIVLARDPRVVDSGYSLRANNLANAVSAAVLYALALVLSIVFPSLDYYSLLVLLLMPLLSKILMPVCRKFIKYDLP